MKILRIIRVDGKYHCIGQTDKGTIFHKVFDTYAAAATYGENILKQKRRVI